jgi:hypothetical protein
VCREGHAIVPTSASNAETVATITAANTFESTTTLKSVGGSDDFPLPSSYDLPDGPLNRQETQTSHNIDCFLGSLCYIRIRTEFHLNCLTAHLAYEGRAAVEGVK